MVMGRGDVDVKKLSRQVHSQRKALEANKAKVRQLKYETLLKQVKSIQTSTFLDIDSPLAVQQQAILPRLSPQRNKEFGRSSPTSSSPSPVSSPSQSPSPHSLSDYAFPTSQRGNDGASASGLRTLVKANPLKQICGQRIIPCGSPSSPPTRRVGTAGAKGVIAHDDELGKVEEQRRTEWKVGEHSSTSRLRKQTSAQSTKLTQHEDFIRRFRERPKSATAHKSSGNGRYDSPKKGRLGDPRPASAHPGGRMCFTIEDLIQKFNDEHDTMASLSAFTAPSSSQIAASLGPHLVSHTTVAPFIDSSKVVLQNRRSLSPNAVNSAVGLASPPTEPSSEGTHRQEQRRGPTPGKLLEAIDRAGDGYHRTKGVGVLSISTKSLVPRAASPTANVGRPRRNSAKDINVQMPQLRDHDQNPSQTPYSEGEMGRRKETSELAAVDHQDNYAEGKNEPNALAERLHEEEEVDIEDTPETQKAALFMQNRFKKTMALRKAEKEKSGDGKAKGGEAKSANVSSGPNCAVVQSSGNDDGDDGDGVAATGEKAFVDEQHAVDRSQLQQVPSNAATAAEEEVDIEDTPETQKAALFMQNRFKKTMALRKAEKEKSGDGKAKGGEAKSANVSSGPNCAVVQSSGNDDGDDGDGVAATGEKAFVDEQHAVDRSQLQQVPSNAATAAEEEVDIEDTPETQKAALFMQNRFKKTMALRKAEKEKSGDNKTQTDTNGRHDAVVGGGSALVGRGDDTGSNVEVIHQVDIT